MEWAAAVALALSVVSIAFSAWSFWWVNGRPPKLVSFPPSRFAASVSRQRTLLHLPVAVINQGSRPAAVLDLRLRVLTSESTELLLPWHNTRESLEAADCWMSAPFLVAGRSSVLLIAGLIADRPSSLMLGREMPAVLEVKAGHLAGWQSLVRFPLHTEIIAHPGNLISYSNDPEMFDAADLALCQQELARLGRHA